MRILSIRQILLIVVAFVIVSVSALEFYEYIMGPERDLLEYVGCRDASDMTRYYELVDAGDREAASRFMKEHDCAVVWQARALSVQNRRPDAVCLRPSGKVDCYWTPESVLAPVQRSKRE
jgi:hypothetical protein